MTLARLAHTGSLYYPGPLRARRPWWLAHLAAAIAGAVLIAVVIAADV